MNGQGQEENNLSDEPVIDSCPFYSLPRYVNSPHHHLEFACQLTHLLNIMNNNSGRSGQAACKTWT